MGSCCSRNEVINIKTKNQILPLRRRSSIFSENITKIGDYKKKYDYIRLIGVGSFGKVRLFQDRNFRTLKYAIKTIKKNFLNVHKLQCIIDEINILRSVDHPNIVKYFETYEEDQYIHIVMEYIPGQNLLDLLTSKKYRKNFTDYEICNLVTSILKAISFLHSRNIIHRDLKPENILICDPEDLTSVKIIDFGLSVFGRKDERYCVGSPYYMAPEMIEGNYSKSSDMWSLGVIIYLVLTGKQPFYGEDRSEVYKNIKSGEYNKKLLSESKISKEICDFVYKLLVLTQSRRMKSEKAFEHPFLNKYNPNGTSTLIDETIIDSLRTFGKNNIIQKEIMFYLAKISNYKELLYLKKAFEKLDKGNTGIITFDKIENIFKGLNINATKVKIKF